MPSYAHSADAPSDAFADGESDAESDGIADGESHRCANGVAYAAVRREDDG